MREVGIEKQKEYAVEDADITLQLKTIFEKKLVENELIPLFNEVEMPLIEVLATMEVEGIALDIDFLKSFSLELKKSISSLEKSIYEQAGQTFNLSSPKQLGVVLFEKLKLVDKPKKTKTGQIFYS